MKKEILIFKDKKFEVENINECYEKDFKEIMTNVYHTINYKSRNNINFKPSIEYIQNLVNVGRKMLYQNNLLVTNDECIKDIDFVKDYILGLQDREWFEAKKLFRKSHFNDTMYLITYGYNLK